MPRTPQEYLHDPHLNKGTGFTEAEREQLGLRGLLPPRVTTQEEQKARVLDNFRQKPTPLEQYIYLISLMDRNEHLFYQILMDHIEEMMPVIYTPTVGEACERFGQIFRRARGLYITIEDRGRVAGILRNWPERQVEMIVATDGERILGLGDLGANGMGIPIGKLSLYTACAGIDPTRCLPVAIDVGTNRDELRESPFYLGLPIRRVRGKAYDELLEEFVVAVGEVFPGAVLQFEDFGTDNALRLLARYRERCPCFNDDIQGTAATVLAGLLSAARITGRPLAEQRIVFLGAGAAALGIANLIVSAATDSGVSEARARQICWLVDVNGLVVAARADLNEYQRRFAHDHPPLATLRDAVEVLRPDTLIGVSGAPGTFTADLIGAMARLNSRPIIFPLSNPTSRSECTAEQAYAWSEGRAVFASGSPFGPVKLQGRTFEPAQGNNAYIVPGVGLGAILAGARRLTDRMFQVAAVTLAEQVDDDLLAIGRLYPPLRDIRSVTERIARSVAQAAFDEGQATAPRPPDPEVIHRRMYDGSYPIYARAAP